jgi:hypothetical protein
MGNSFSIPHSNKNAAARGSYSPTQTSHLASSCYPVVPPSRILQCFNQHFLFFVSRLPFIPRSLAMEDLSVYRCPSSLLYAQETLSMCIDLVDTIQSALVIPSRRVATKYTISWDAEKFLPKRQRVRS